MAVNSSRHAYSGLEWRGEARIARQAAPVIERVQPRKGEDVNLQAMPAGERMRYVGGPLIVLAVWLFISPFVLQFVQAHHVMWNSFFGGLAVAFLVGLRVSDHQQHGWISGVETLLGIWFIISPWALGESSSNGTVSMVVVGVLVVLLAGFAFAGSLMNMRGPAGVSSGTHA